MLAGAPAGFKLATDDFEPDAAVASVRTASSSIWTLLVVLLGRSVPGFFRNNQLVIDRGDPLHLLDPSLEAASLSLILDVARQGHDTVLVSDRDAPLERRWISIPTNVWHRPVIDAAADWAVVSFHTVPAEELIEERPDESRDAGTRQMTYLGSEK